MIDEAEEIIEKALFNEMISAGQLKSLVDAVELARVVLLDIRTPEEQAGGIIPGSRLMPCDHNLENRQDTGPFKHSFDAQFAKELFDSADRHVLICRSGPRTEIALERFLESGLLACELIGGILEWERQSFALALVDGAENILDRG